MNTLTWIIDGSFSTKLTLALLHFLWQGCAGGLIVMLGGWLLRGGAARSHYMLNVSTMLVMAACLPVTFLMLETPTESVDRRVAVEESPAVRGAHVEQPLLASVGALPDRPEAVVAAGPALASEPDASAGANGTEKERSVGSQSPAVAWQSGLSTLTVNALPVLSRWVTILYLTGVALILARLLRGVWGGHRLRRMAMPIQDAELLQMVRQLAGRLGMKIVPTVAWCAEISIPVVVGIVSPMILLPLSVTTGLTAHQIQALMLHELSHIRRFDPIVNLLQRIIEAILFFHPAVWFVSRRISIERELAADDMVLAAGWDRPLYAEALIRVAELASSISGHDLTRHATVLGAAGTKPSEFKLRVLRLLGESPAPKLDVSRTGIAVTLLLIAGGTFAWSQSEKSEPVASPSEAVKVDADAPKPVDDEIVITGSVIDADGEPVAKATIVYLFTYVTGKPRTATCESDRTGAFRLIVKQSDIQQNRDPSRLIRTIWAGAEGHGIGAIQFHRPWDPKTGTFSATGAPVTIPLQKATRSSFVFKTESGEPLVGASVVATSVRVPNGNDPVDGYFGLYSPLPEALRSLSSRLTDAEGRVVIDSVPRQRFDQLEVTSNSHGTQRVRLNEQGDEQEFTILAPGSVRGRLIGGPPELMRGMLLSLSTSDGYVIQGTAVVATDDDGVFDVPAIAAGVVQIRTNLDPTQPWKFVYDNRTNIEPGQVNDITFQIAKGIPVTARLVVQGSDQPVAGARVSISTGSFTNHDTRMTDERGEFQTFVVPGQDVVLQVTGLPGNPDLTFPRKTLNSIVIPTNVETFRVPDIEIPKAKTWTGRLVDQSDRPIVGKYVQAWDGQTALDHPARTDKDEMFKLKLRDDQVPNRWSVLMDWNKGSGIEKEYLPATIDSDEPFVLRVIVPDDMKMLRKPALLLPDHWIVRSVGFDNDGKELVTASNQSFATIRRWDLVGKKLISEIMLEGDKHGRDLRGETMMLSADWRKVIAATDAYVGIWETATGKLLKQLPIPKDGNNDTVRLLTCTPDFSVVVGNLTTSYSRLTLRYDAHTVVWNGRSGKLLNILTHPGQNDFIAISLSSDGKRLATTNGGGARTWDVGSGEQLLEVKNDNSARKKADPDESSIFADNVWSLQFSPDGRQLAIGDTLGIKLIDATSGQLLRQLDGPYRYSSGPSPGLVFSSDGKMLARLGTRDQADYVLPIWSTETGQKLFELQTAANDVAFSRDGQQLAVGFSDLQQALTVWQLNRDGKESERTEGPGPEPRQDKVEQNGHYRGETAAKFVENFSPVWSEAKNGVQYGIALTTPQRHQFHRGERVPLVAFFRNASDKPIKIDTRPDYFGNAPRILDGNGMPVELENVPLVGHIAHYVETLEPGEAVGPFYFNIGLGENPRPGKQHWYPFYKTPVPGRYTLTHSVAFNVGGLKEGDPQKPGEIISGRIEFEIVTGKPEEMGLLKMGPPATAVSKSKPGHESAPIPNTQLVKELASFQGTWCFDILQIADWPQPIGIGTDSEGRTSEKRMVVKGNQISWTDRQGEQVTAEFTVDPLKIPKQIDFTFIRGPHKGQKSIGIYESQIGNDAYRWLCMTHPGSDAPRPTNVSASSFKQQSMIGMYPVAPPDKPSVAKALERFQGVWNLTLCDSALKTYGATQQEASKWQWTIKGDEVLWNRQGEVWKLKLAVDSSKRPREIDLTYLTGPYQGEKCLGMYEFGGIDDQSLLIAIQDPGAKVPRPQAIAMSSTSQTGFIFLRPHHPSDSERQIAQFQGTWTLTNYDTGGNNDKSSWPLPKGKGPDKSGNGSELRWVVKGKEITWTNKSGEEVRASYTIDPAKRPKQIDLTFLSGPDKGETCLGIYQRDDLDENILWLCIADPKTRTARPKEFSYQWGEGRSLISLYPLVPPTTQTSAVSQERPTSGINLRAN